jgi:hypothetical protein
MSWQIPTLIEADIKSGKAQYRTFQTGNGGQSIMPVPSNSYVVIFGYDFSPAGGGWHVLGNTVPSANFSRQYTNTYIRPLETQQISFYTGTDFYPFIHHVNIDASFAPIVTNAAAPDNNTVEFYQVMNSVNNTPIARQVYITSTNDVTITHGLISNAILTSANAIPVTSRTPQGLTYGGSGLPNVTQTNYGPGATPLQFMQPSPKDYEDFAFGLLPANADGQSFATPDATNGLFPAANYLSSLGYPPDAAGDYYLCLHYALYTETVPESRG